MPTSKDTALMLDCERLKFEFSMLSKWAIHEKAYSLTVHVLGDGLLGTGFTFCFFFSSLFHSG